MAEPRDYTIHLIGHGHIDPTWRWRWTEGYEEVRATFMSALQRMNETPAFKFTTSSACFFAWIKASDPDLFEEIRERVREGRWELVGGMWIEPDCNLPSGESFVRQGLYGQRYFKKEFGAGVKVGFNPDSFGHAGTLPQILKKLGIEYYAYMRPMPLIEMNYPEGNTFWWLANDGSRILASNIPESYNGEREEVLDRIQRLPTWPFLMRNQRHLLCFYGVGNHGGGPTIRTIEGLQQAQQDKDLAKLEFSTLEQFFKGIEASHEDSAIPTIDTDLQHHARGCYSVHSEIKRLNRRAEQELMAAERFATLESLVHARPYPKGRLEKAWKDLLYNQFHDILAGSSIEESYEDAREQLGRARFTAREIVNGAVQSLSGDIDTSAEGNTIIVFNPLPWPVKQSVVAAPHAAHGLDKPAHLVDEAGKPVASQGVLGPDVGSRAHTFVAEVPALGYRSYHMRSGEKRVRLRQSLKAEPLALENDWWRIEFDPYGGHISRLFDKRLKFDVLGEGNVLAAMVDQSDTWSHGIDDWRVEAGRFGNAALHILEDGDVRATMRITSRYGRSTAEQFVTLHREHETIDCRFRINWQERYTMLKLGFETAIEKGIATYDTAYGYQVRNTAGFEEPGQMWFDLSGRAGGKPYGLAILNDCTYGYDVRNNVMRVTLLRSPLYAHHDPNPVNASEPYSVMDQGWHTARFQLVPHAGTWEDAPVVRRAWELNAPAFVHLESSHSGSLAPALSFLECTADEVAITVLKHSEDGDDLIVRGYETTGRGAQGELVMSHSTQSFEVEFAPHEIKTLRINPETWEIVEVNLLEE